MPKCIGSTLNFISVSLDDPIANLAGSLSSIISTIKYLSRYRWNQIEYEMGVKMAADYNGLDKGLSSINYSDFGFSVMLCPHNSYMQYVNPYCKVKVSHTLD